MENRKMKIGIVGYGHVGKAMFELFKDAEVYDKFLGMGAQEELNLCDTVFICVPTPPKSNGECDTSAVEEVLSWLNVPLIIIRSTVPVGFTDKMREKYDKEIVFQPEYFGETVAHPFADLTKRNWLTFGGSQRGIDLAIKTYKTVVNSNVSIYQGTAKDAEFRQIYGECFFSCKGDILQRDV